MRRNQSGMTLLSFIIVMAVVGFFLYIVMKLFPMYSEYYAVRTALKGLASESGIATKPAAEVEKLFFRRLYISYSTNVKPENVHIEQAEGGPRVRVDYEVRKPLVANLDVVAKFHAEQSLTGGAN